VGDILSLAMVLAGALAGGRLAVRLGYPAILGEILAGVLIGPAVVGLVDSSRSIQVLGELGVLLMMLSIGMHLDPGALRRASGAGVAAAIGGFVLPLVLGVGLMLLVGRPPMETFFVGLAMAVTSLAVNGRILVDLGILDTRVAYVLMAGALLSDLAVLVAFAAVLDGDGLSLAGVATSIGSMAAFASVAWVAGSRLLPRAFGPLARLDGTAVAGVVMGVALLYAWGAELAGLHAILGTFVAGLFLTERHLGAEVSRRARGVIDTVGLGILAPVFFVSVGFEVSLEVFRTDPALAAGVVLVATVGKVGGAVLAYVATRKPWREGLVVGAGMNGRGAVEIIVAEIALAQGIIGRDMFSIIVLMAVVTTATVPIALTRGADWLRRRGELVKIDDRQGVLIVGAGPVARILARLLRTTMPVRLVDTNRLNQIAGTMEGLEVVAGSGVSAEALEEAGLSSSAMVLALTPNTEVNLIAAQLAVRAGVPTVAAMIPDAEAATFSRILDDGAISRLLPGAVDLLAWDQAVTRGRVEERAVVVGPSSGDLALSHLGGPDDETLALAVVGRGERRPWTDGTMPASGDEIVVLVRSRIGAPV
jgi:Kef-type K+ transport system membrane component KefB